MKNCLLLGSKKNKKNIKKIEKFIKKNNWKTQIASKKINVKIAKKYDLIISYGYRHIIKKKILKLLKRPAVNLHISYLPYNRGAHPNFWSFFENTPSGVTIHEIDSGIDTGKIIFQKKIFFDFKKNKNLTFKKTYEILHKNITDLFILKVKYILDKKYFAKKQNLRNSTFHYENDLSKFKKNWNKKIFFFIKNYEK